MEPASKCMWVETQEETDMGTQEETEMGSLEVRQPKPSDQLELVSLKESIIQKAWAGWEEGLRLGHRKWEIGEATVMMESTNDQLILTLRLTEA